MSCLSARGDTGKQLGTPPNKPAGAQGNSALAGLREDLGDEAAARFVAHYLDLLERRINQIGNSIKEGRTEPGITLLLTLESSSHMVGANELCARATELRLALGKSPTETRARYQELVRAAAETRELLATG